MTAETCVHHWVIDTPNGAVSRGVCKRCSEEREFSNVAAGDLTAGESFNNVPVLGKRVNTGKRGQAVKLTKSEPSRVTPIQGARA